MSARQHQKEQATGSAPTAAPAYRRLDVSPEEFFRSWSRERKEALIEVLIEMLDATDPDPDVEPSLGSVAATRWDSQASWAAGDTNDLEDQFDDREDDELEWDSDQQEGSEEDVGEANGHIENLIDQDVSFALRDGLGGFADAQRHAEYVVDEQRRKARVRQMEGRTHV